jgi:hypothetical protein
MGLWSGTEKKRGAFALLVANSNTNDAALRAAFNF